MSLVGFTLLGSLEAPSLTGSASDVPLLVKPNTEFTVAMLASLDVGGGDLRFSSDAAGTTQLACEIVDGLDVVWVSTAGLSVATGLTIYVWGDNTGASQPAVGAAFGRDAVWVDYLSVYHGSNLLDSTANGNDLTAFAGAQVNQVGLIGGAFEFTAASSQYMTATSLSGVVGNDRTISALFKVKSETGVGQGIATVRSVEANVTDPTFQRLTYQDNAAGDPLRAQYFKTGGNNTFSDTTNKPTVGAWSFGAGTFDDDSTVTTLLDGTRVSVAGSAITPTALGMIYIGAWQATSAGQIQFADMLISTVLIYNGILTSDFVDIQEDNQSTTGAWWIAEDAGGAISVTESLTALTINSFNPSIDFTGVVSVTESLTNLNLNSFNPTIGLTATLTVTESLTNLEFNAFNPIVTLTPPNTIIVTEATTSLTIDSFDPTITFSGTISVTESLTNLDFRAYRPTVQVGAKEYTNIFYGVASQQVTFTGTSVSSTFSGTIKQAPDFSGIIKTSTFSGVSK